MSAPGVRPGRRDTFLLHDKKVPKEACPAAPALTGFPRSGLSNRPASKLASLRQRSRTSPVGQSSSQRVRGETRAVLRPLCCGLVWCLLIVGTAMELTLIYRGPLKANGDAREKHRIRRDLSKQLAQLWKHPPLSHCANTLLLDIEDPVTVSVIQTVGAFKFASLVCSQLSMFAELSITWLRPHSPGALIAEGGDIDNRLKTLFDALRMPHNESEIPSGGVPLEDENPFHCLLEDDGLITSVSVSTDRLLEPDLPSSESLLLIHVRTKTYSTTYANIGLG